MRTLSVASLLLSLLSLFSSTYAAGSVLAIDYGVDSFKASLIKPGVPFDVLLNRDSKRKTPSSITLRGEERHVGGDSVTLSTRFPRDSVAGVKLLLGSNEEQLALHNELYSNTYNITARGSHAVAFSHGLNYTVEEVLAMQLAHVKEMASSASSGGEKPSDVIVTVPTFFDQVERQAVLDAIDLAGLKPLSLLNDGTAVAVNYALSRSFEEGTEHHLFYDAGASSIRATLAAFSSVSVPDWVGAKTSHNATQIEILGVGWDRTAGGYTFDARLRDLLVADFAQNQGKKLKVPVQENERAMAKLLKEAARVKQVLSANTEAQARIESLAEDVDFKAIVSRDQFDAVCADMAGRLSQPINEALAMANLTVDALDSVVLVGGHSRVPAVQNAVKSIVPEPKIAQNVNADEAAVMGAALYGAIASRSFRTKDIRVRDIFPHVITLSHNATLQGVEQADGSPYVVFQARSTLGTSANVSFVSKDNISLLFSSSVSPIDPVISTPILEANITGIDSAHVNLTDEAAAAARIDLVVELAEDGLLRLSKPRFVIPAVPAKAPSAAGRLLGGLFGSKSSEEGAEEGTGGAEANDTETTATAKAPVPPPLGLTIASSQSRGLNKTEKIEAKRRLRDIEQAESKKRTREEARNGLESFLYRLRDQLEESDFTGASTDAERSSISKKLSETTDWLWDEGEKAVTKDLRSRRSDLDKLLKPIRTRLDEAKTRDEALSDFSIAIIKAQGFYLRASTNATEAIDAGEPVRHTPEELESLRKLLDDEQAWLKDLQAAQDKLQPYEDPILRRSEMERRAKDLTAAVMKLARKPKPRKPKPTTISASAEEPTASSEPVKEEPPIQEEPPKAEEATPPRHEEL